MSQLIGKQRGQVSSNVRESGKSLLVEYGNLGRNTAVAGIWNTAVEIRIPLTIGIHNLRSTEKDLESSNWIPESTAWNPESKTAWDIPLHGATSG